MHTLYKTVFTGKPHPGNRLLSYALGVVVLGILTLVTEVSAQTVPVITSQESLCQATGKVIVKGNSTFFTFLTGSSIPQLGPFRGADFPGDSVVFSQLAKGNYTVTQINPNNNEEKTYPVTVTGNYEQNWIFTATPSFGPCSEGTPTVSIGNITISGATPAQQRPDYFFRISAKNGSLPADGNPPPPFSTPLNGSFSIPYPAGLGGTYEIQGRDVCGNYKTIKVNVPSAPPGPSVSSSFVKFINCGGDAEYDIKASGGTGPYVFKVKSGPDQVNTTITHASQAGFTLKAGGTYVITVTDQCGGSKDITVKPKAYVAPTFTYGTSNGTCSPSGGTGSLRIVTTADGIGPFTIKINSTGTGCGVNITKVTTKSDTTFVNLPRPCSYTVTVTDGCNKSSTQTVNLIAPGADMMGCSKSIQCPTGSSEKYRLNLSVTVKPPYNPTPNYTYVVRDSLTKSVVSTSTQSGASFTTTELSEGKYYIDITDACGATCRDSVLVPKYTNPTVSVDVSNKCFGTGQANVIGINNRGVFGGTSYTYKIIAPSASRVGDGPEADSPAKTGQFSSLVSGGSYTFSFSDGCKTVTTQVTIPTYQQPTWEVGFGAICPPNTKADIQVMNLQPAGKVVGPYTWRIISTDSPLYASTAPYNGTLPYPNSLGKTDSTFAALPAKDLNGSVATYNIQGVDGCKNSYLGSGKVGALPKPSLVLDNNKVCPDGTGSINARPGTPVVGATYVYFRDGVKIAQSKKLFTTLSPALPGTYRIKVYPTFETDTTCSGEATAIVTSSGIIKLTKDSLTCAKPTIDLTKLTKGSSAGVITFYTDRNLTQVVSTPTAVSSQGVYYVKLVPAGLPDCIIKDSLTIKNVCCVKPVSVVTVTNPNCTTVGKLTLTSTNGDKYGISKGNTYVGPGYATASAVPTTLPAIIKANISNSADSSFTIRIFNGKSDCFKDTTVTVKAVPAKPAAGSDQTLACADPVTNTLTTSTTLKGFSPAGGTWMAQTGNPAPAKVTNLGAVTDMSVAGIYRFIYSVNGCADTVAVTVQPCAVCAKPDGGPDQSVCAPQTTSKLTAVTAGGVWSAIASPANPAAATIDASGNITGLTANGTYKFVYTVSSGGQTCIDTASVVRNAKPVVSDISLCAPATTAMLAGFAPGGGTWNVQPGNPVGATVSNAGVVSGLTANGAYRFIYTVDGCADTASVVRNAKPSAGVDKSLACADPIQGTLQTSTTLSGFTPAGGTWSAQAGNPAPATVTNAGAVAGMSVAGTYKFIYTVNSCADTVAVTVQACAGCTKPDAGPDMAICAPLTASKLSAVTPGGTWSAVASPVNPAGAVIDAGGNVSGMTANGTYRFVYSVLQGGQTCSDTVAVVHKAKPVVGNAEICEPATKASLTLSPSDGTWSSQPGNPSAASVSPTGAVTGLTANGAYRFIYTVDGCSDTATVIRNARPNAGGDKTLACADPIQGTLQTSTTLSGFTPAGGTWSAQAGNPAPATVINTGAVAGMSVAGTYQFIYTINGCADTVAVTVQACAGCTKPNAGNDQSLCEPTAMASLTGFTPAGGTWSAQAGNPAPATVTNTGAVSGMTVTGTYRFIYSVVQGGQTCSDTVQVIRRAKPVAGNAEICEPATTASVTLNLTGGSWVAIGANPASATIAPNGQISGLTANGTYRFMYTLDGCSDTSTVIRKPKPVAGPDITGTGAICNTVATVDLPDAAAGESWTQLGTTPKQVTINATSGVVTGMDALGVYQFILANSATGCSDTVNVEVKNCNKGSIGDFVWKDLNDNGIQDAGEPGVSGIIVKLLNGTTDAVISSDTTDTDGAYGFPNLESGSYKVKIVVSTLPDSCLLTSKKDVATGSGNDTNDSDFDPATGESPLLVIDVNGTGTTKDNPTIDAGLYSPRGSIGDFVWKDLNDNGQQDKDEPGVNGVKVILWQAVGGVPTTRLDSMQTAGNGGYLFTDLKKDEYIVQIALNTLPDSCQISLRKDVGNDATDNDFTPAGLSSVVSIDPARGGINKDNPTIDAGLYSPCIKPVIGLITPTAATCTGTITNSDAAFTVGGIIGGNRYTFATTAAGLATYANANLLAGGGFSTTGLPNPGTPGGQSYFIRIYNGKDDCFLDATVLIPFRDCSNNCVKPKAGADVTVCKPVTTANLPDAAVNEEWVAGSLNPSAATVDPVTGVVNGLTTNGVYSFILRDKTLSNACSDTVFVFRGVLELPKQSTCSDTLTLPPVDGATYTQAAGNPASITAQGFASGMGTPGTVYTFIITKGQCSDTVRVERLKCDKDYDLSLKKSISKKLAMLGDTLSYTIEVKNEGEATAHGVEVTDVLNAGVQYIGSVASLGGYSPASGKWQFDSITVGTTLSLTIQVRVVAQGVWFNTAEITHMTEKDQDSTPGNGAAGEDDIDHACFTVPILLCRGQGGGVQLNVPAQYSGVVWFRKIQNGTPVQVAMGNTYVASETELGSYEYTFTSTSGTCPAEGCCPILIAVQDCCPAEVCVPFVITRKNK